MLPGCARHMPSWFSSGCLCVHVCRRGREKFAADHPFRQNGIQFSINIQHLVSTCLFCTFQMLKSENITCKMAPAY